METMPENEPSKAPTAGIVKRTTVFWFLILLLLPVPFAILNAWLNPNRPAWTKPVGEFPFITVAGLDVLRANGTSMIIDARTPAEFNHSHIPGALNLYPGAFDTGLEAVIDNWMPEQTIAIYCGDAGCASSEIIARRLRDEVGFENIYLLEGGWERWLQVSAALPYQDETQAIQ